MDVEMRRTLESTSMFDVEFNDVYCGSVAGGPYRHLLLSDELSPAVTGTAVALQPGLATETASSSPTTTGTERASLGGATTGTCCLTALTYPPTAAICDKPLVPVEPATISYGCASSTTDGVIAYHNSVDIQSHLSPNKQVN